MKKNELVVYYGYGFGPYAPFEEHNAAQRVLKAVGLHCFAYSLFDIREKEAIMTNYQAFLAGELLKATDKPTSEAVKLVLLHYHQAMFSAIAELPTCQTCDTLLATLKDAALPLAHTVQEYLNQAELVTQNEMTCLIRTCAKTLPLGVCCSQCKEAYQHILLANFYKLRHHHP